ncbi:MAG TPA: twin transmembrane helix small protein [Gammaproteobacteria bacterium]
MPYRVLVIAILLVIIISLGSALYYLVVDKGQGDRMVKALTVRVGVSLALILFLLIGMATGLISPPL